MMLLDSRVGPSQLEVLAHIVECNEQGEAPRQKDIVERSSLSKGAVSNNCKKLLERDLIKEDDSRYHYNEGKIRQLYKEHLESYLEREREMEGFKEGIARFNKIRTRTKKNIQNILDRETGGILQKLITKRIVNSKKDSKSNSLSEVFLFVDMDLQRVGEAVEGDGQTSEDLQMLAVAISRVYQPVASVYTDLKPENTITKIAKELEDDV